ncbi:MAG: amino acid deaminase/aldolase [Deltaproteobacteria bacterium]|nr:MAG: amino acid deaminase/aldolase [Deltaproteobacteria bacterium]
MPQLPANHGWDYEALAALVQDVELPAMVVDLDALDENIRRIAAVVEPTGKTMRLATKSVRVPALIQRILDKGGDSFQGMMCFSVREAKYLSSLGLDDFLVAYPFVQPADLQVAWDMTQSGLTLTCMVDSVEHIAMWESFCQSKGDESAKPIKLCIDADMSYRPMGLHLGVQRSPVRTLANFQVLAEKILACPSLQLYGVMGYEAQIAGLGDASPFAPLMNPFKAMLKSASAKDVAKKREAISAYLEEKGVALGLFNGGGTGSLGTTTQEPWLTEVTAGSGFLQSHLFDYYRSNKNRPAFCFGLRVTRIPQPGTVTCQSGGFVASGEVGLDKIPAPFLPEGLKLTSMEAVGEVQTPLQVPKSVPLKIGDPVFFRPAKAGEIAEHFQEYLLVQGGKLVERIPTYRGTGQCFY